VGRPAQLRINEVGSHSWELNSCRPEGVKLARAIAEELELTHGEVMSRDAQRGSGR
jgi:hypothetical protein